MPQNSVPVPRKLRLRTTLVLPFVLEIVAAVGLVGWLSFHSGQQAVNNLAKQLRSEVSARIDAELRKYLSSPHDFNTLNAVRFSEGSFDMIRASNAKQFLTQVEISPFVYSSYCGDFKGQYLGAYRLFYQGSSTIAMSAGNAETDYRFYFYAMDARGNRQQLLEKLKPYDPRKRPWYKAAVEAKGGIWSEVYLDFASGLPTITASEPVYDSSGEVAGVCATDVVLLEDLRKFLANLSISKTGQAFVIDRSGFVLSSSTDEPLKVGEGDSVKLLAATESQEPLVRETARYLQQQFGNYGQIKIAQQLDYLWQGERQFVQVLPLNDGRGIDWLIVVVVPEADFMGEINSNTRNTIVLCSIALLAAIALGILTSRWITQPIQRIAEASQQIAKGNLDQGVATSSIIEIDKLAGSFNSMAVQIQQSFEELEERVEQRTTELRQEKERSELLLLNILPSKIAEQLKRSNESLAEYFAEATILFADIVGFTTLAASMEPLELVNQLNQIFSAFDRLAEKYGLEKIKTIGDAYMVVGGLPTPQSNHAEAIADMALEIQAYMTNFPNKSGRCLQVRIGINTGPAIAGVIGTKKFAYDLWGDAVNIASRMESHGEPGSIQVTDATYERLKERYIFEKRGNIYIKGRGDMTTYWLRGKAAEGA